MANIQAKFISLKTNKLIQFIVYSNIWISIGATFLCWQIFYLNQLETNYSYLLFIFFSTLFSYNLQRLTRIKSIAKQSPNSWVVKHKQEANILLAISFVGALCTAPIFKFPFTLFWLVVLGIVSVGYSYKNFRDIPYLKIIMISISWGIACAIIPFIIDGNYQLSTLIINFCIITLYITAITIPFDIRDLGLDEDTKKTIPQVVGISKAKNIALLLLGISLILFAFQFAIFKTIIYMITSLLSGYLIKNSKKEQEDIYYTLFIDGHIILQFLLIFFLS